MQPSDFIIFSNFIKSHLQGGTESYYSIFKAFSPLGLAKVGGWSWCNSALHLIIGAFRDNGEGRWNQFPASSTNMGQPSSPSTPSSLLSYLSTRQVWNEDGRCLNTADWFDLHSCSTLLEAFRGWWQLQRANISCAGLILAHNYATYLWDLDR